MRDNLEKTQIDIEERIQKSVASVNDVNKQLKDTVNTLPLETIDYLLKSQILDSNNLEISKNFESLFEESKQHFDFEKTTNTLLVNGIKLFQESYKSVLDTIDQKISKLTNK